MRALIMEVDEHLEIDLIAESPAESQELVRINNLLPDLLDRELEDEEFSAVVLSCTEWRDEPEDSVPESNQIPNERGY